MKRLMFAHVIVSIFLGACSTVVSDRGTTKALTSGIPNTISSSKGIGEITRDGRFIAYNNGTVLDTKTRLMWVAQTGDEYSDYLAAEYYCENYRGCGYTDWRMPTLKELETLYDPEVTNQHGFHVTTKLIDIDVKWILGKAGWWGGLGAFKFSEDIPVFYRWGTARGYHRPHFGRVLPVRGGN